MDALINLQFLVDDAKCFDTVRRLRWSASVRCARCGSDKVARDCHDDRHQERQRYRCTACQGRFDDLCCVTIKTMSAYCLIEKCSTKHLRRMKVKYLSWWPYSLLLCSI